MLKDTITPVINGFKVLASESKWVFIKGFRRWEIKQLQKRLAEEYQTLGQNYAAASTKGEAFDPTSSDNDLSLKQITFLLEEISHLEQELSATKSEFIKNRTQQCGPEA